MVERIDWPQRELDVALGIDMVQHFQADVGNILHVHVFVYYDDAFSKHRLPQRPDGVHHLARLSGIGLANGNDHQVMEHAFDGQVDVHQFRNGQLHQRQENALDRLAHPSVFLRRLADDGRRIDRIFSVGHAGDVKHRILVFKRVEAGVVAEGPFGAEFVEIDVAFEDDLGSGRNFEVNRLAFHQLDRLLPQESGDDVLLNVGRRGDDGGKRERRFGADGYGHVHPAGRAIAGGEHRTARRASHDVDRRRLKVVWQVVWQRVSDPLLSRIRSSYTRVPHPVAVMFRRNFLPLPVHAGGALVIDLHPVHADVALPGRRIARDHAGQRDEASAILWPAFEDGEIEQREIVALDNFFTWAGGNGLGKKLAHLGKHRQHLHFVEEALRRLHIHEAADALGDFVKRIDFERKPHTASGAKLVDEKVRAGVALKVLEQKSFAADSSPPVFFFVPAFRNPIGNLRNL